MDGTLNGDGGLPLPTATEIDGTLKVSGGGGGGPLFPLFIFLVVLSLQALDAFLEIVKKVT